MTVPDEIETILKSFGNSSREIDAAFKKHDGNLKGYLRSLRERKRTRNREFEREHNERWIEQQSVKSKAFHTKEKREAYQSILGERKRQSLSSRLQRAFAYCELLDSRSTTTSFLDSSASSLESKPPPGLNDKPLIDVEREVGLIRNLLENVEAKIDAHRGLREPLSRSPKERIDLLDRLAGVHSKDVSRFFPELGHQRSVEAWRKRLGEERKKPVAPSTGLPKEK